MTLIETSVEIGKLFKALSIMENKSFDIGDYSPIESSIEIQDQNNQWKPVTHGITKNDTGINVVFESGINVPCAFKHKIRTHGTHCKFAGDLKTGDIVIDSFGNVQVVKKIEHTSSTVFYDITIDSDEHLYRTSDGIVHHNTEAVKQLAKSLDIKFNRFDMSEYSERHAISKLIGAPPGYVGHGEGDASDGALTNAIENNPYSVLLLDEVEKAHPDIFDVFLQVFDDGRLTNSSGKTVDFTKTIIIMTSNIGAQDAAKEPIGFAGTDRASNVEKKVKEYFKPEFLNRLDAIVKFDSLKPETMVKIVDKFIGELNVLSAGRNIVIEVTDDGRKWLAEKGYDKKFGARPLGRVIAENIKKPLSKRILFGDLKNGGKVTVEVNPVSDELMLVTENDSVKVKSSKKKQKA